MKPIKNGIEQFDVDKVVFSKAELKEIHQMKKDLKKVMNTSKTRKILKNYQDSLSYSTTDGFSYNLSNLALKDLKRKREKEMQKLYKGIIPSPHFVKCDKQNYIISRGGI